MKKKWTVFSLVILLIQYFSPLVAVAESIATPNNSFNVSALIVGEQESVDPNNVNVTIKGNVEAATAQQQTISLSGFNHLTTPTGKVVSPSQVPIGTYQASGQTLQVTINEGASGPYELNLNGQLLDKQAAQQTISAGTSQQTVTAAITLKAVQPPVAEPTTPTLETEQPGEETSNSSTKEEPTKDKTTDTTQKVEEKKSVKATAGSGTNIEEYLNGKKFFTGMTITDENDGNLLDPPVQIGDLIKIQFDFAIPEDVRAQIKAGDFYKAELPTEIHIVAPIIQELTNGADGEPYGKLTIDTDGNIFIEFYERVTEESEIIGEIHLTGTLAQGDLEGPGPGEIEFPFVEDQEGVPIIVKPNTSDTIRKEGHADKKINPNQLIWDVDINVGLETLNNVVITEAFPEGTEFESVKVFKAKVDFDGNIIEGELEEVTTGFTVDAKGNVTFEGKISDAYRLEYTTNVDPASKPLDGSTIDYYNNVTIKSDELEEHKAGASITGKYNKPLEKENSGYDPATQTMKWTIKYNYTEFDVPEEDATVTDEFTSKMILENDSMVVNRVTFDDQGLPIEGKALVEGQDYVFEPNPDGEGFVIKFIGGIDYAVNIHYQTAIDEEVTGNQNYTNKVVDGSGHSGESHGQAHQQGLIKDLVNVNHSSKVINWEILINQNGYEMKNWSLHDQMSPGLTLSYPDGRKFVIHDLTEDRVLEKEIDYTFIYNEVARSVEVEFIGEYAETSNKFKVLYDTKFDTAYLNEAGLEVFTNDVSSTWTNKDGSELHSEDHDDYKPRPEDSVDGFKSGDYNAKTKEITWTLGINYNTQDLGKVTITDPITSNQKYISKSLQAFKYTIDQNDGSIVKGEEILPSEFESKYRIEEPSAENGQVLTIELDKVGTKDQVFFTFKTSLVGEVINASSEYHNKATVEAKKVEGSFSIQGDVSIANGGSLIQKNGKQDKDGYLHWTATINPSQSTVYDAKVTDHPSPNQSIDLESVKLYETEIAVGGKITQGAELDPAKYTVSLTTDQETGEQELIVVFNDEKIETAYILEYKAMLMLEKPSGEKAYNNIKLEGTNKENVEQEISKEVGVQVSEGGGTAVGKQGSLTIRKVDDEGKVLTGASFELWDKNGKQKLREGEVAKDGTLDFAKLPFGDYLLKETKAPAGYSVQEDLIEGRKVTINEETSTAGSLLDIVNEISKVELSKEAEDGTKLAGAVFKLEVKEGDNWTAVADKDKLTTDDQGKLVVKGLTAGTYRFIEVTAPTKPQEFVLDSTPIEFEVVTNDQGQTPPVTVGPAVNYLGSASFIKTDSASPGKVLAGAEFKLTRVKNVSGETVKEELAKTYVSDKNGRVLMENLSPGEYEVTETRAPNGYLINTSKYSFTIDKTSNGKPAELVIAKNFIDYQGSMSFIKKATDKDGKATEPLAGAEFEVKSDNGKVVKTATSGTDGKVLFTGLAPGTYTLRETKAAPGYILNTETTKFKIADKAAGEPEVVLGKDFLNYKGSAVMMKVNTSGEGLPGAEFTLYTADDKLLGVYTSDDMGHIEVNDLSPGEYKLVETKAPLLADGTSYIKNEFPREFKIESEHAGKVQIQNLGVYQNFKGKVIINKKSGDGRVLPGAEFKLYRLVDGKSVVVKDAEGNDLLIVTNEEGDMGISDLGPGSYKLEEVKAPAGHIINTNPIFFTVDDEDNENPVNDPYTFKNYEASIKFNKTDDADNLLIGATFNIYERDEDGNKVGDPINENPLTSTTGEYQYKGIEAGKYVLEEVKAPDGYIRNTTLVEFEVEDQIGEPEVIELADFVNYKGSAEFIKTDQAGDILPGAEFSLTDAEGNEVATATSDQEGKVSFTDLAPGKYIAKETKAPEGYVINTAPIEIEIVAEGEGKTVTTSPELADFVNYKGSASVIKTDGDNHTLAGAEFAIYDSEGKELKTVTTKEDGLAVFKDLAVGEYTIKEIKAPTGYIRNEAELSVTVEKEAEGEPKVVELGEFVNYKGTAELIKKGEDDQALAGAEFEVYNKDNKLAAKGVSNEEGKVFFAQLAPGKYTVKETKAPAGHLINTKGLSFTVADSVKLEGEQQPATIELGDYVNYQGSLALTKVDGEDKKQVLADAEFKLEDGTGKAIKANLVTDENGQVTVDKLAPGTYFLVETKAPKGYQLATEKVKFVIAKEAVGKPSETKVTVTNDKTPVDPGEPNKPNKPGKPGSNNGGGKKDKLPQMNELVSSISLTIGLTLIVIASSIYRVRRRAR